MDTEKVDLAAEELRLFADRLSEALVPVWSSLTETLGRLAADLTENLAQINQAWRQNPAWEFVLAYAWACGARPKWVRILNRTKKHRTRKKYQDRILRAYRKREE